MRNEVNRAHKAKTTLKYLLILFGLVSVLSLAAQTLAQQPEVKMASTSVMAPCGSALPQAVVSGAVVTGSTPGTYTPANVSAGPRKIGGNTEGGSGDREDPYKDPIGDAMWPLMLLALAYVGVRAFRKKARVNKM